MNNQHPMIGQTVSPFLEKTEYFLAYRVVDYYDGWLLLQAVQAETLELDMSMKPFWVAPSPGTHYYVWSTADFSKQRESV